MMVLILEIAAGIVLAVAFIAGGWAPTFAGLVRLADPIVKLLPRRSSPSGHRQSNDMATLMKWFGRIALASGVVPLVVLGLMALRVI
jgi:hypothetical protein